MLQLTTYQMTTLKSGSMTFWSLSSYNFIQFFYGKVAFNYAEIRYNSEDPIPKGFMWFEALKEKIFLNLISNRFDQSLGSGSNINCKFFKAIQ